MSKNLKYLKSGVVFLGLVLLLSFPCYVGAQTEQERMEELKLQIEQLEKEAAKYRDNIAGEKAEAASLQAEINSLKNQIGQLENQIQLTGKKIDKTSIEIDGLQNSIYDTQKSIDYRKSTIAELLAAVNKSDAEPLIISLIKNRNLSDFLRQEYYARNINADLLDMIEQLKVEKNDLQIEKSDLEGKKQDLEDLKRNQGAQKSSLNQVTSTKNTLLKETKGQEALYQKMLQDTENKKMLFFTELRELETKVIQGGLYIVHITASNLPKKGTKLFSWPEATKRITQGYGMTSYAKSRSRPYGGSPHNGIDMANGMGSEIRAIGEGEIIANGKNDGWGNWVAIKHPNQYNLVSVYAHMSSLSFLRVGTQVKQGQVIGYEGATGSATGSHLHLSIYKDFFTYVKDKTGELYFNYFDGSINPLDYL